MNKENAISMHKDEKHKGDKTILPHNHHGWNAFIAFLIATAVFINTHLLQFPGSVGYLMEHINGQETLDMSPSFSTATTYERLDAFGGTGRALYMRTMLTVDIVFPLIMFLFLYLLSKYASHTWRLNKTLRRTLGSLPILYLSLDFLENLFIFLILNNYPEQLDYVASHIGYITTGKRIAMFSSIIAPFVLLTARKLSSGFALLNFKP